MNSVRRLCGLLVAALLIAGCSSSQDFDAAKAGIARFRELMAAQQFDQIYSEASDDLKKATTSQNLVRLLAAIDRKLGAVKSTQADGWKINYNPSGTTVQLGFKTQFEKGTGSETFVFRIAGGKALLSGYNITSNELITN
jgi:major membrane immunogen (membrane-anchored lipoprotein)